MNKDQQTARPKPVHKPHNKVSEDYCANSKITFASIHESGHACSSYYGGSVFEYVTVKDGEHRIQMGTGIVLLTTAVAVCISGGMATRLLGFDDEEQKAIEEQGDRELVAELTKDLNDYQLRNTIKAASLMARTQMRNNWRAYVEVAAALTSKGTMTYAEVAEICERWRGVGLTQQEKPYEGSR